MVGAGPAGADRGDVLARAGRSVVLVDKATFPRDKCCGDGLTTLALRELEALGFDPATVPNWFDVDAAWLRSPSGREVCVPLPAGTGMFAATDAAARARRRAGRPGPRRRAPTSATGTALASIDHAELTTRVDVVIDGARRVVHARYVDRRRRDVVADAQAARASPRPATSASGTRSASTPATSPGRRASGCTCGSSPTCCPGYMWSFPLPDGRVNIGFGVQRDGAARCRT